MASQLRNRHLSRPTVLALALGLGGERWDGQGTLADEIGVAVLLRCPRGDQSGCTSCSPYVAEKYQ